ncbi:MAG: FHA domain-containing protein [Deltaproteobacteria bacterium]|nr:FHA domain-containing protein [Deltaproteobacteria bacterium]
MRRTITLDHALIKIGKAPASHVKLDFDDKVSRMHAIIDQDTDQGTITILDLGSLSGTYVNGTRVNKAALVDGDVIVLGDTKLELSMRT